MHQPVLFRDRSRPAQIVLGGVVPALVGVVAGVLVGVSSGAYWAIAALAGIGAVLAGFEHQDGWGGADRGLVGGDRGARAVVPPRHGTRQRGLGVRPAPGAHDGGHARRRARRDVGGHTRRPGSRRAARRLSSVGLVDEPVAAPDGPLGGAEDKLVDEDPDHEDDDHHRDEARRLGELAGELEPLAQ